jgi:molybdate/tungstate transport system ATP-binding protein
MTGTAVEHLSLTLGGFALREVDLAVEPGEILVLLGPNGAGKSVTLETIAGFHRPRAGRIVIGGRDVTQLVPERRHVGLVFQNFGLFPHLSVAKNVALGLRARRGAEATAAEGALRDVAGWLDYFGIAHLAERAPHTLSAGEQQRASLARVFANRPELFLFDEPFSALDARTRDQLRHELGGFLRAASAPSILVTHDHLDARALADRIAVMKDGAVAQQGTVDDIFRRPVNRFIADFVGIENVIEARIEGRSDGLLCLAAGSCRLVARDHAIAPHAGIATACIRADDIRLRALRRVAESPANLNRLEGAITAMTDLGPLTRVTLDCGIDLIAYVLTRQVPESGLRPGATVEAEVAANAIHITASA